MVTNINNIIEELKSLTLLEAAELVKKIEEVFDVDASAAPNPGIFNTAVLNESAVANEAEEKTDFDIVLEDVPAPKKIAVLRVVRSITSLGLKEAKELVESSPKTLKESASKEEAEKIKAELEEAGAKVSIK